MQYNHWQIRVCSALLRSGLFIASGSLIVPLWTSLWCIGPSAAMGYQYWQQAISLQACRHLVGSLFVLLCKVHFDNLFRVTIVSMQMFDCRHFHYFIAPFTHALLSPLLTLFALPHLGQCTQMAHFSPQV